MIIVPADQTSVHHTGQMEHNPVTSRKGIANWGADALSRGKEVLKLCLSPTTSNLLIRTWNRPRWDLLVAQDNMLCSRYFTLDRRDTQAAGVDAFHRTGAPSGTPVCLCLQLVPQVLAKVIQHRTSLILLALCWEDAAWLLDLPSLSTRAHR